MRSCRIGRSAPELRVRAKPRSKPDPTTSRASLGQRNTTVMSYFPTCKGGLRMESLRHFAHRSLATLLETDPEVVQWTTEIAPVQVACDRAFTPNFLVTERHRQVAIRVLRTEQLASARREERHQMVETACARMGMAFEVRTEEDIKNDPWLPMAEEILWHRPHDVPQEVLIKVGAMASAPPSTLGLVHDLLGGGQATWPVVISLIARGCIEIQRAGRLCAATRVLSCGIGE